MPGNLGNNYGKFYSFGSKPLLLDLNFVVDSTNGNGLGVRSVKGQGVKNVYMQTSATPATGNPMVNTTSAGYCLIELEYNYTRIYGGFNSLVSPLTGSAIAINGSSGTITPGLPYVITSVGAAADGAVTVAPTGSDVSGSLASKYFTLFDSYGNTWTIWFYVTGVGGQAPIGVAGTPIQITIAQNATVANQTTALSNVIALLPSGVAGVNSFTTSGGGTATLTITSTSSGPLPGAPTTQAAGSLAYPATFADTIFNTNLQNWQHVGLPPGVIPAIGVSFIATAAGSATNGGSTGQVHAVSVSGVDHVETIGDSNLSLGPIPMGGSPNVGGFVLVQFLLDTTVTAPANGTVCGFTFYLEGATRVGGNQE